MAVGVSVFAAAMLMMSGLAAALNGIAALINDTFFVKVDGYIYAFDATTWGWIHLLLGAAFVAVGVFIVMGQPWAYLVGIVLAGLNGLLNFMWLPVAPIWAVLFIAIDVLIIWALASTRRADTPSGILPAEGLSVGSWRKMYAAMDLVRGGVAGRVRVVHDRLVSHEQTDHVRQLTRVAEVDRVGGSLDHREHDRVRGAAGDLLDSAGAGHQRVPVSKDGEGRNSQGKQPIQRRILGKRTEHPHGAGDAEPQIVRYGHSQHPRRLSEAVVGDLSERPSKRLVVQTTSRRDEDRPLETIWIEVRELADDGAAHRVADQRYGLDLAVVEEGGRRMRHFRHVERFGCPATTSEPGQIGDERVEVVAQPLGRRQKVTTGEAESVEMHHHPGIRRLGRLTIEDVDTTDRRPSLREGRRRPRRTSRRTVVALLEDHGPQYPVIMGRQHLSGSNRFTDRLNWSGLLGSLDEGHDDEGEDSNRHSPDNVCRRRAAGAE